jgi:hypothetical protein
MVHCLLEAVLTVLAMPLPRRPLVTWSATTVPAGSARRRAQAETPFQPKLCFRSHAQLGNARGKVAVGITPRFSLHVKARLVAAGDGIQPK